MTFYKSSAILLGLSLFLLCIGIILLFCIPTIVHLLLSKNLPLSNGSLTFKIWSDIPIPVYQKIYFFNITNPDAILKGEKPIFKEVGPYIYKAHWYKENITFHENSTISYREIKTYKFMRNLSNGDTDDIISTINAPMVVAATLVENSSVWVKLALNAVFWATRERLFIKKTVKELTYTGYRDPLMILAPVINPKVPNHNGYFAWLYGKNDTDDGLYNVFTGKSTLEKLNIIDKLNDKNKFFAWNSTCSMMNGTNGEFNPPLLKNQQEIHIFQTDICRSWYLDYKEDSELFKIPSKRFEAGISVLQNASENPANACFNVGKNLPSGAMDISPCQFGAPVVLSYPHFYLADPSYLHAVKGLSPEPSKHKWFMDLEPITGLTVNASVRLQINLYLKKIHFIWPFYKLSPAPLVFPVLWQEVTFYVTEDLAEVLKSKIFKPQLYAKISSYLSIGLAVLLILSAFIIHILLNKKQKLADDDPLLGCGSSDDNIYGHTNDILKENGRINHDDDDEPAIRDV
ncbi:scavenger receptor class B member 1-like isoform X1 [Centruroides sculpturatus]|uniref:scavenger receptor class B member 1-like isoform X1 n=1 Tax=Centruroides sculpturatus TaxID=218467 RepID=UPI000C6DB1FC|nr:scavenger receptor class B member 1-like isoform X1 [Centruroides sculpturatus]XP_023215441.1 scavenger receptor class B member 1-like isoform X1 [Centruroides sculpturatus]XP_023215442.1 scavenger receptor class B member 1-like isoform X1 [Centruroides sculpturatus]XP_023215443.1 scavenger receptor class B member 1-like isoform X1 [Centruroides sculpturatus]XP_023215444.1 scavenger receptor class B member 1-like isoform X1 [Centruroides sculpturatus]XP_023215445.1 scavenger receptor class 